MVQLNAPVLLILRKEKLQVFRIYIRTSEFNSTASDDRPQLTEHLAYRWFDPTALPSLDWAEADVPVVREFIIA